jgi:serine protease Do
LPRDRGVLIQDVTPGKAAADAGVQNNDVVTRVEGRSVSNLRQFSSNLFRSEIGGKLKLEVLRGGTTVELQVALKERDDDAERFLEQVKELASPIPQLGVLAVPLNPKTAVLLTEPRSSSGCIVAAKLQTASTFQEELEPGDVVLGINGESASDVEALAALLRRLPDGMPLVVRVERQGVLRYLVLRGE